MIYPGDIVKTTYDWCGKGIVNFLVLEIEEKFEGDWDEEGGEEIEEYTVIYKCFSLNFPDYTHDGGGYHQIKTGHWNFYDCWDQEFPDIKLV